MTDLESFSTHQYWPLGSNQSTRDNGECDVLGCRCYSCDIAGLRLSWALWKWSPISSNDTHINTLHASMEPIHHERRIRVHGKDFMRQKPGLRKWWKKWRGLETEMKTLAIELTAVSVLEALMLGDTRTGYSKWLSPSCCILLASLLLPAGPLTPLQHTASCLQEWHLASPNKKELSQNYIVIQRNLLW